MLLLLLLLLLPLLHVTVFSSLSFLWISFVTGPENCELNSSGCSNGSQEENQEFRLYNIRVISAATNNFSNDNKIGQGGFGPVYKVTIPYFSLTF